MALMTDRRTEIASRHVENFDVGDGKTCFPCSVPFFGNLRYLRCAHHPMGNFNIIDSEHRKGFVTAREETREPKSHTRYKLFISFWSGTNNEPSPASPSLLAQYTSKRLSVHMTIPTFSLHFIHEIWPISVFYPLVRRNGACLTGLKNYDLVQCRR